MPDRISRVTLLFLMTNATILYSDPFCQLTPTHLVIYTYYFPIATSLSIPLDTIVSIQDGDEYELSYGMIKTWGMALSPIWWALDGWRGLNREYRNMVVVTVEGDKIKKGFSCMDAPRLMHLVKERIKKVD